MWRHAPYLCHYVLISNDLHNKYFTSDNTFAISPVNEFTGRQSQIGEDIAVTKLIDIDLLCKILNNLYAHQTVKSS